MRLPWVKKDSARTPHLMAGQGGYVFRRSRTLTGSTSERISASAETRGHLKTERLKLHELRAQRNQLLRALSSVAAIAGFVAFLIANLVMQPTVQFAQSGAHQPSSDTYRNSIGQYLADHPLERFGFALNASELGAYLTQHHKEIRGLEVIREWYGGDVKFTLVFREPLLVWKSGDQQFYVDDQGVAFRYNHFAEPAVAVTDQSGIAPDSGGVVASTRFIAFLGQMVGAVNGYNKGRVNSVIIPASTREIDLRLDGRDYVIKTESDRDPLQQAQDISYAIGYFDAKGVKPLYIDVRVPHKAFYRV